MDSGQEMKVFEMQADVCLALGNPRRLQILSILKSGEKQVSQMVEAMGINKANMSQHLAVLRQTGLIVFRREGTAIFYRLASPKISEACSIMRDVLLETLREKEQLARGMREETSA